MNWRRLKCDKRDVLLSCTLTGGQSFRWKKILSKDNTDQYLGVFDSNLWILEQTPTELLYQVHGPNIENSETKLKRYLRLDVDFNKLFVKWCKSDPKFEELQDFYGVRVLRQNVTENIFSFICSSNNQIHRITSMVEKLAQYYGKEICEFEGNKYFAFPEVEALAGSEVEAKLKELGFGYRARYINKSAQQIVENGGSSWLEDLKSCSYTEAKEKLLTLNGIGPKVADCICLMSLDHLEAIPVDTHVFEIAKTRMKMQAGKTVTKKIYEEIGNKFREVYGSEAGWAQTVLFCSDLKQFSKSDIQSRKKLKQC